MHYTKLFSKKALCAWLLLMVMFSLSLAVLPVQAQPFAYVSNASSSDVSVIDVATNTEVSTVTLGGGSACPRDIAITPDGALAYVGEEISFGPFNYNQVEVIATASNTVVATISFGDDIMSFPRPCVAITPDGVYAYVGYTNLGSAGHIAVIDVATNTVVTTVDLGQYQPNQMAITPDGAYVYIVGYQSSNVQVLATASNTIEDTISIPQWPYAYDIAITPDGAFAYVSISFTSAGIYVIDLSDKSGEYVFLEGAWDGYVAITPDGNHVYVTNEDSDLISVIATADNTVETTINLSDGSNPRGISITPDGAYAYVANFDNNSVSVIDTTSNAVVNTVTVGTHPQFIAITPGAVEEDNDPPVITNITVPVDPTLLNTAINASASFTDATDWDDHSATWDWGDNSTSAGTVDQSANTVTGSHAYTAPGVYTVTLTITDGSNNSGEGTAAEFVVIYDPEGGFVTGGGWITSPEGAFVDNPSLTGKANFGFNSKYKNGASVPTGNTEFQFKLADLNFNSASYEWLVLAGPHAKYKGVGTINGSGDYGFMLTATDGQISGGGGVDKFRIKIWDKNNNDALVYDNQIDEDDDSYAGTELGGGSIVIHQN